MGANASTSPPAQTPKASNPLVAPSPLVNAVNTSNDTTMTDCPDGTLESNGANG